MPPEGRRRPAISGELARIEKRLPVQVENGKVNPPTVCQFDPRKSRRTVYTFV